MHPHLPLNLGLNMTTQAIVHGIKSDGFSSQQPMDRSRFTHDSDMRKMQFGRIHHLIGLCSPDSIESLTTSIHSTQILPIHYPMPPQAHKMELSR
jgi:hypothetical protein